MNNLQRAAIMVGIVLLTLSGLFLPFKGVYRSAPSNTTLEAYMGYHFAYAPPNVEAVADALQLSPELLEGYTRGYFSARISVDRVLLQTMTIILITIGFIVFFSKKHQPREPRAQQGVAIAKARLQPEP